MSIDEHIILHNDDTWIRWSNTSILYRDYRNMTPDQIVAALAVNLQKTLRHGFGLRMLFDVRGSYADKSVLAAMKSAAVKSNERVERTAVIGVEGVQLFFLNLVVQFARRDVKHFPSYEQALDYLASAREKE